MNSQFGETQPGAAAAAPAPGGVRVPPGALAQYYGDLASGVVVPEDMRLEDLQFTVQISPTGNIVFSTDPIMLVSRYNFAFRRMVAWAQDPDLVGAAPSLVSFNIREQGRNFNVFKRPVNVQSLLSRTGSGNIHEWDGVYITVPGTELDVAWTVDTARWVALVNAAKEFGVQLLGDYVACAPR
jgi:hypothetical protein